MCSSAFRYHVRGLPIVPAIDHGEQTTALDKPEALDRVGRIAWNVQPLYVDRGALILDRETGELTDDRATAVGAENESAEISIGPLVDIARRPVTCSPLRTRSVTVVPIIKWNPA